MKVSFYSLKENSFDCEECLFEKNFSIKEIKKLEQNVIFSDLIKLKDKIINIIETNNKNLVFIESLLKSKQIFTN